MRFDNLSEESPSESDSDLDNYPELNSFQFHQKNDEKEEKKLEVKNYWVIKGKLRII